MWRQRKKNIFAGNSKFSRVRCAFLVCDSYKERYLLMYNFRSSSSCDSFAFWVFLSFVFYFCKLWCKNCGTWLLLFFSHYKFSFLTLFREKFKMIRSVWFAYLARGCVSSLFFFLFENEYHKKKFTEFVRKKFIFSTFRTHYQLNST